MEISTHQEHAITFCFLTHYSPVLLFYRFLMISGGIENKNKKLLPLPQVEFTRKFIVY